MDQRTSGSYTVAIGLALALALLALFAKLFLLSPEQVPVLPREIPELGDVDTAHDHASILFMSGDEALSLCEAKYMLKSPLVHFENNDCVTIHKHAIGITLPYFLETLGITLTEECLVLAGDKRYCADKDRRIAVVVNGAEVPVADLPYYELRNNDHILINHGNEAGSALLFKYNQVPNIPLDVNEPVIPAEPGS